MTIPVYQVDAFTKEAFSGNPAAVCLLQQPREAHWMQSVAREMNLSETAFLCREDNAFRLRWFTPAVEVELCGHATLASAHVLWEQGVLAESETIHFRTLSGILRASRSAALIEMDFPSTPDREAKAPAELSEALGIAPAYVGKTQFDFIALLTSESEVRKLAPDFKLLRCCGSRGVIVTAISDAPEFDFVSRFFAPACGIDEDPVTGSAHCCLGPFWARRLGKTEFRAFQASERGGVVNVRLAGDRVILGGCAITVMRGELLS